MNLNCASETLQSPTSVSKGKEARTNQMRDEYVVTEELEHLDSFSETLPLTSNRILTWDKARAQKLMYQRGITISPDRKSRILSLSCSRKHYTSYSNICDRKCNYEQCADCSEALYRAPSTFSSLHGKVKLHLDWSSPKQQQGYLPHYCKFVTIKELHSRSRSSPATASRNDKRARKWGLFKGGTQNETHLHRARVVNEVSNVSDIFNIQRNINDSQRNLNDTCPNVCEYESISRTFMESDPTVSSHSVLKRTSNCDTKKGIEDDSESNTNYMKLSTRSSALPITDCNNSKGMPSTSKVQKKRMNDSRKKRSLREQSSDKEEMTTKSQNQDKIIQDPPMPHEQHTAVVTSDSDEVAILVPDLPAVNEIVKDYANKMSRISKYRMNTPKDVHKSVPLQSPNVDQQPFSYHDFNTFESTNDGTDIIKEMLSNLNSKMHMAFETSRFELPVDLQSLESLSSQEYLRSYCTISSESKTLCHRMFHKYKGKTCNIQGKFTLFRALKEVLVHTVTKEQVEDLCDLLEINNETSVDIKLFVGMKAVAERTFNAADKEDLQKENMERADFHALNWKLCNLQISRALRILLGVLMGQPKDQH